MKKILFMVSIIMVMLSTTVMAKEISIVLNGEKLNFDQPPVIINDRTMVPMRGIFEALGADIDWEQSTKTVTATLSDKTLTLQVGNYTANQKTSEGKIETYTLDTPAQIVNNRTLVPVRFIAESLGAEVEWDNSSNTVVIQRKSYIMDVIKTVDMYTNFHENLEYRLDKRPFYALVDEEIYYMDKNRTIRKFNVYTGEESVVLNLDKCIKEMSAEDDIFFRDPFFRQLFYDKERNRLLLNVTWSENHGSGQTDDKAYEIQNDRLVPIMPDADVCFGNFLVSMPGNKIVLGSALCYADTGACMETIRLFTEYGGSIYKAHYIDNKIYYCNNVSGSPGFGVCVYDFGREKNNGWSDWDERIISGKFISADINGEFIYALASNGDIEKYDLSGKKKEIIKSSDISLHNGIVNKTGELMLMKNGDMILFNGREFMMLKKTNRNS